MSVESYPAFCTSGKALSQLHHIHPIAMVPQTHPRCPSFQHGLAVPKYKADITNTTPRDPNNCRKASYGHPSLDVTPGIFTVYCPLGVCYGFDNMQRCESRRHPFEIFSSRLPVLPQVIVYMTMLVSYMHTA